MITEEQLNQLLKIPNSGKFGGATGNLNAHYASYPKKDWHKFSREFLNNIGLKRSYPTTQIEHYDNLASQLDAIKRINTILIDLCRDIWMYIAMNYFNQKLKKNEVGSSAMPHKINPIDFENAEGNLGLSNAVFNHLSSKLPVSRLQRDLTDSTTLRNIGIPFAYSIIAYKSLTKGISKLIVNKNKINHHFYLSKKGSLHDATKNLYTCLRKIKNKGYKSIAIQKIKNLGLGKTINDRLYRASNK